MLPPELSTSGPASRVPRPGVVTDAPTVIPPRIPGLAAPGGQGSSAGGGGTSSKASVTLKDSLSELEKVVVLLRTLQAECNQFVLERQRLVEQHEAELRSVKSKVKSSATQKSASLPLSSPIPPLTSQPFLGDLDNLGVGSWGPGRGQSFGSSIGGGGCGRAAFVSWAECNTRPEGRQTFAFEPSLFVDPGLLVPIVGYDGGDMCEVRAGFVNYPLIRSSLVRQNVEGGRYHTDVIASVQTLGVTLVHRFFNLQFSVIARCDLSPAEEFFSTMVDFRLYDNRDSLVEARGLKWMQINAKLIEDVFGHCGPSMQLISGQSLRSNND
ncbi:hypothetical protein BS47DRAFT_1391246 [Hydnum rufescens UP504]|uniref:Uncharacterized protein n=1 Tax=Hydnum rufescens UP504 TaxID=1448309 RepID=A0A9P6B1T0_9AGAM|nr:hypothetical protein BS47DRAFT_1391246 [Hydnum rufescens UP504]